MEVYTTNSVIVEDFNWLVIPLALLLLNIEFLKLSSVFKVVVLFR